jgi:hypothetical protein
MYLYSKTSGSGCLSASMNIPALQTGNSSFVVWRVKAFAGFQFPSSGPLPETFIISPNLV